MIPRWLLTTLAAAALIFAVASWAVGRTINSMRRRRAHTAVGAAAIAAALHITWARRRTLAPRVAALAAAATLAATAWAAWHSALVATQTGLVAAAVTITTLAVWDWTAHGARPLRDVLTDWRRADTAIAALRAAAPEALIRAVRVDGHTTEIDIAGAATPPDPDTVAAAHNTRGPAMRAAGHRAGDAIGSHTITLADASIDPWSWAHHAPTRWPGPAGGDTHGPIPFGVTADGDTVAVPFPGDGGKHLLIAGATGAGKSTLLNVLLADLAHRDVDLWLGDPKWVELRQWAPIACRVAIGDEAVAAMVADLDAEMMRRYEAMDGRQWAGRRIVAVVDELAAVTGDKAAERMLSRILAMGRAAGVGLVLVTQRPSANVVPLDLRDNCRVRIALGMESPEGTRMILGASDPPAHLIPESLPGVCWVRVDRTYHLARSWRLSDSEIDRIVDSVARRNARTRSVT